MTLTAHWSSWHTHVEHELAVLCCPFAVETAHNNGALLYACCAAHLTHSMRVAHDVHGEKWSLALSAHDVEAHLREHPAVDAAVVVGLADERLGERVAAFVVAPGGFDLDDCRAWFEGRGLTRFLTPEYLEVLGEVPLLPTGKPDRAMESSAWSSWVSRLFQRHAGVAIAPKTLRSIFITWLRSSTSAPEILQSAAHAQKHSLARQGSDD